LSNASNKIDVRLKEWATSRQLEYIDAVNKHKGNLHHAAKALNITRQSIQNSFRSLKKKAALQGYSPAHDMTRVVPSPFVVKGVSTYYNKDGQPAGQWLNLRLMLSYVSRRFVRPSNPWLKHCHGFSH
jgi:hypothetical protein